MPPVMPPDSMADRCGALAATDAHDGCDAYEPCVYEDTWQKVARARMLVQLVQVVAVLEKMRADEYATISVVGGNHYDQCNANHHNINVVITNKEDLDTLLDDFSGSERRPQAVDLRVGMS